MPTKNWWQKLTLWLQDSYVRSSPWRFTTASDRLERSVVSEPLPPRDIPLQLNASIRNHLLPQCLLTPLWLWDFSAQKQANNLSILYEEWAHLPLYCSPQEHTTLPVTCTNSADIPTRWRGRLQGIMLPLLTEATDLIFLQSEQTGSMAYSFLILLSLRVKRPFASICLQR